MGTYILNMMTPFTQQCCVTLQPGITHTRTVSFLFQCFAAHQQGSALTLDAPLMQFLPPLRYIHEFALVRVAATAILVDRSLSASLQGCSLVYNVVDNTWSAETAAFCLNTARSDSCAAVVGGKIYVAGECFPAKSVLILGSHVHVIKQIMSRKGAPALRPVVCRLFQR